MQMFHFAFDFLRQVNDVWIRIIQVIEQSQQTPSHYRTLTQAAAVIFFDRLAEFSVVM